ncbi:hypothetical protein H7F33_07185 [Pedobacter sp. PAMC26386]|nr:hypothetical protein H7F33_07185 [Pedobacter sp. PAMC26386]
MNSIPHELNGLLHYSQSLAKLLLNEQGEFHPFGAYLNKNKVITQRMFNDGDDYPLSIGLINIIKNDFDQQQILDLIGASAITYEAKITNLNYPVSVAVIVIRLNASFLNSAILCYLPYKVIDNEIEYMESWVEED